MNTKPPQNGADGSVRVEGSQLRRRVSRPWMKDGGRALILHLRLEEQNRNSHDHLQQVCGRGRGEWLLVSRA